MQPRKVARPSWCGRVLATLMLALPLLVVAGASRANAANCTLCAGGEFFPVTPSRILDTRSGVAGNWRGAVPFGQAVNVQVAGLAGVPAADALAVAVNVTVVSPTVDGFLTLYPAGQPAPTASNVNFAPGEIVPNMAVVGLGDGGKVSLVLGPAGRPGAQGDVLIDVVGWYAKSSYNGGRGGRLTPTSPTRIMDSRVGQPVQGPFGQAGSYDLQVAGNGGVPGNATAVVVNVTATRTTGSTYVRVTPSGAAVGGATEPSNLNLVAGETRPNLVMVGLGQNGKINLFNQQGNVDLIVDVVGYYAPRNDESSTGRVVPLSAPFRAIETRGGVYGGDDTKLGPGQEDTWNFKPFADSLNAGNVVGAIMNVTATDLTFPYRVGRTDSWMALFPSDQGTVPNASNLNYLPGQTVPNLAVVKFSADQKLAVYNDNGYIHYLADVGAVILA